MSLPSAREMPFLAGFPRVSGDEPAHHPLYEADKQFSPRERG